MARSTALIAAVASALVTAIPAGASADEGRHLRLAVGIGAGKAFDASYFIAAARVGYAIALGIEPSVEAQWWMGAAPSLGKLAPGLTWYLPLPMHPYLGAYYAHWFIESGGQNALGARGGVELVSAGAASLTVGVAYERLLACSASCDAWWPEATVGFRF